MTDYEPNGNCVPTSERRKESLTEKCCTAKVRGMAEVCASVSLCMWRLVMGAECGSMWRFDKDN